MSESPLSYKYFLTLLAITDVFDADASSWYSSGISNIDIPLYSICEPLGKYFKISADWFLGTLSW